MSILPFSKSKPNLLLGWVVCAVVWAAGLLFLLNSFQVSVEAATSATPSDILPQRVAVITMPKPYNLLLKTIVLPNGQAYALSMFGALAMLKDDTISNLITFQPTWEPFDSPDLKNTDFNPYTNLIYTLDSHSKSVYVVSDTQIITSLAGTVIFSDSHPFPLNLIANPTSGEIYVSALLTSTIPAIIRVAILSDTRVITSFDLPYLIHTQLYNLHDLSLYFEGMQTIPKGEGYTDDYALLTQVDAQRQITTTNLTKILDGMGIPDHVGISAMTIDPQSGLLYLRMNRDILRWDGEALTPLATIELKNVNVNTPMGIDWKRGLVYLGIPYGENSYLEVFDIRQGKLLDRILSEGVGPQKIIYDAKHDYIYIANYNSSSLSIVRGTEVVSYTELRQCGGPWDIALDDKRDRFYVTCADWGGAVSIFEYPKGEPPSLWNYLPWINR